MMRWRCSSESDTAHAARAGEWPDGLRTHAADCPVCRDVALVAGALVEDRRLPVDPPAAGAGRIWWMGQLRTRRALVGRALRPISVMELVAIAVVAPAAAVALASALPLVSTWLSELRVVSVVSELGGYAMFPGMMVTASAVLAFLLFALAGLVTRADG